MTGISKIKSLSTSALKMQVAPSGDLLNSIPNLTLFIYNSDEKLIFEKDIPSNGVFEEELNEGKYTAIAAAYSDMEVADLANLSSAYLSQGLTSIIAGEVFLEKVVFEVKPGSNYIEMILKRQVGLIKINITDAPSSIAFHARATLQNTANEFWLKEFMPLQNNYDHQYIVDSNSLDQFGGYFMVAQNNQSHKTNVLLEIVDDFGRVVKSKLVENITVGTNIKTTLTGKLFEKDSEGFFIEVDADWEGETNIEF